MEEVQPDREEHMKLKEDFKTINTGKKLLLKTHIHTHTFFP